ncbi:MAG: mannose-6-phosphate isomerase, class I [Burkholderiaceae bacterium]|nr:mannose-6-phosphate isomerase, class I [Microbacteriaceae bacterium]
MFVGITNTPRPYAWGSTTAIADLLGTVPSGGPEAELWLGAHAGSPSRIVDPRLTDGAADLAAWVAADPQRTLGSFATCARLPFLLKVLAAEAPLSLQAHPTNAQAREGFRLENAAGVPADAPDRNYRDEFAKPELVFALSERFEALCGFRPAEEFREIVHELQAAGAEPDGVLDVLLERLSADDGLRGLVEWLSLGGPQVDAVVAAVAEAAPRVTGSRFAASLATVTDLAAHYPGDPGIVISLLLHRVSLRRGEVLYLPAGNIHAYLSGLAVELMAASDNVLRGGLTPKHVDVPELLSVLDFRTIDAPYLEPERPALGVEVFRPDVPDFVLVHVDGTAPASVTLTGPAIALCVSGSTVLRGAGGSRVVLSRGESLYITPDEGVVQFGGADAGEEAGEVFLATTG